MNTKALEEQRADLQAEMENILNGAKEETRALSETEVTRFDEIEKEIKSIDATIAAEKRALDLASTETEKEAEMSEVTKTPEQVETDELRAFEEFVRNNETRAEMLEGDNGAIVPVTIANKIIKAVRDRVPYLQLADVIETNGKLSVPVYGEDASDYINADYVDEGKSLTDNVGKFTTVDLTGYVVGALSVISNKLINNTDINITDFIVNEVARAMAEKLEKEFTVGTSGKITGITTGEVKVTTAAANAITYDELVTLKHSVKKAFRGAGKFIMNDATYTAICKLKDANGQPYFKDDDYKILGCEVLVSDSMPEIGSGNKAIVFADLSGYTIKMTKNVEVSILRELYAPKNMVGVMAFGEFDAKITDSKKVAVLQMA